MTRRVKKSYSRYCSAPAIVTDVWGFQPVSSSKSLTSFAVTSRASSESSAAVSETEKNADGSHVERRDVTLDPVDDRALMVADMDRCPDDDEVVVAGVGLGGVLDAKEIDLELVRAQIVGEAGGDPAGMAVRAGVDDECPAALRLSVDCHALSVPPAGRRASGRAPESGQ